MGSRANRADRRATERRLAASTLRAGCCRDGCTRPVADVLGVTIFGLPMRLYVCDADLASVRSRLLAAAAFDQGNQQ